MTGEEEQEAEESRVPAAVVINTPSTGRKIIVQLTDELLIETELPFEEDFKENVKFLVDETMRLGDRILRPIDHSDIMIQ